MKIKYLIAVIFLVSLAFPAFGADFKDNGNGTVTDADTGLVWQQATSHDNWDLAMKYCENLQLGNQSDWRLPTTEELKTILDTSKKKPAIDKTFFPDTVPKGYWTSTVYNPDEGGLIYFFTGIQDQSDKLHSYYFRCVRGGK